MAAIDFPASPANGQTFVAANGVTYVWNGTLWLATPPGVVTTSDTAPASPAANQLWFNSVLGELYIYYNDGNTTQWVPASPGQGSGAVVQTVSTQTGAFTSGTTIMPFDATIPQISEGTEFFTCAITPRSATSKLIVEVLFITASSASVGITVALFQDSTANALVAAVGPGTVGAGAMVPIPLRHTMTSGTTSTTTFRVRAGPSSASTLTMNGGLFGGVAASSITIQEVL